MSQNRQQLSNELSEALLAWKNDNDIWPLMVWIRTKLDDNAQKISELFEMDDDTALEFYSWGHNSKYKNVFLGHLINMMKTDENHVIDILREVDGI